MKGKKDKKTGLIKKKIYVSQYNMGEVARYLEDEARMGFVLVKVKDNDFYFQETEPTEVGYMVELYNKNSNYEGISTYSKREFVNSFNNAGWICIGNKSKYYFFCNRRSDIPKVYIDQQEKYNTITNRVALPELILVLICFLIYTVIVVGAMFDRTGVLSAVDILIDKGARFFIVFIYLLVAVLYVLARFVKFKALNEDIKNAMYGIRYFDYYSEKIFYDLSMFFWIVFYMSYILEMIVDDSVVMLFISIVTLGMMFLMIIAQLMKEKLFGARYKKKFSDRTLLYMGMIITVAIISIVVIVIKLAKLEYDRENSLVNTYDIGLDTENCINIHDDNDYESSIFGQFCEGGIEYTMVYENDEEKDSEFKYEVLRTDFSFINKSYINKNIKYNDFKSYKEEDKEQARLWNANTCYVIKENMSAKKQELLLVYDECIVFIGEVEEDFSQQNAKKVYKKLVK